MMAIAVFELEENVLTEIAFAFITGANRAAQIVEFVNGNAGNVRMPSVALISGGTINALISLQYISTPKLVEPPHHANILPLWKKCAKNHSE
jgi:hypothetical protein